MLNSKFVSSLYSLVFAFFIFFASTTCIFSQVSQTTAMAQLRVLGSASKGEMPAVNINGEGSVNGSNFVSPARIAVPAGTMALINFGNAGQIELSAGTVVNITFKESDISIDLSEGRLRITSLSDANFSIKTADGIIANDKSQSNIFVTELVGGATGVNTEVGVALVNGNPVPAGGVWTANPKSKSSSSTKIAENKKSSRRKTLLRTVIIGAAGVGAGIFIGSKID